jgi:hypothetical protein
VEEMRRTVLLLASMALAMFLACGVALALPSEPDQTPTVNGTVRTIEQVGTNIWVGGKFTQFKQCKNPVDPSVLNLAVFDSETNNCRNIAPRLGGTGAEVWDMMKYGGEGQFKDDVLIAGKFSGSSSTQKNLVRVDGTTGTVKQWYNSPSLKSVLAAPNVDALGGEGRVYGGGVSLTAFDTKTGKKVWSDGSRAKTTVNTNLYPDAPTPGYRDLELDTDGKTIWAACACDAVGGSAAKALVKLNTEGSHDASWRAAPDHAYDTSWGMSVVDANGALYLGAGGSDYLAEISKASGGDPNWVRDTSGSVQVVEEMDRQLVIGGHFWEVADQPPVGQPSVDMVDKCGHGRSGDVDQNGIPTLDPNGKCETRKGIAAYSFDGKLDSNWSPTYAGKYSLVWALHVDGTRLHTGGEFLTVNGVTHNYYARLS